MKIKRIGYRIAIVLGIIVCMLPIVFILGDTIDYTSQFDEYKDYCLFTIEYKPIFELDIDSNASPRWMKVWFLPFQKKKLLNKIQNDVISYMDALIEAPDSPFSRYEISENFEQIYIYRSNGATSNHIVAYFPFSERSKLITKLYLYHQLLDGYQNENAPHSCNIILIPEQFS